MSPRRSSRLSAHLLSSPSPPRAHALSTSSTSGPSTTKQPATPYFEEWPTEALQSEVRRYGFKVSRKRGTLIDQLKAIYEALGREGVVYDVPSVQDEAVDAGQGARRKLVLPESTAVVKAKGKGKGRMSDPFVLDEDSESSESVVLRSHESEAGDYTAQLELEALSETDGSDIPLSAPVSPAKPRRGRPPRSPSASSTTSSLDVPLSTLNTDAPDAAVAVEPSPALASTMTTAIRSDPAVWGRILRYEPISFDEFVSIATINGVGMDSGKRKEELRTWLDRQCICFYSNDLTGPRSRH